ncbi:hypothetical protein B0H19DRAFT_1376230 [Mycena capillaripes]|nr:hypothetical protein B0H19DRAFT_1376230 [Mycena capillaripes]
MSDSWVNPDKFLIDRTEEGGVYDFTLSQLQNMPHALANLEYIGTKKRPPTIFRGQDWAKNIVFRESKSAGAPEFKVSIVGEVCDPAHGTLIRAHGNHYDGREGEPFKPVDDHTKAKDVIVLQAPSHCSTDFMNLYHDQTAIIQDLENTEKALDAVAGLSPNFRSCLKSKNPDADSKDLITITTLKKYGVCLTSSTIPETNLYGKIPASAGGPRVARTSTSTPKKVERVKRKFADTDDEDSDADADGEQETPAAPGVAGQVKTPADEEVKLGAFYDPRVLEDYGGPPFFQQTTAKLYAELRTGTLVLVLATVHVYAFNDRKTVQLTAHSIRVLDESEYPVQKRTPPVPRTMMDQPSAGPSTPGRSSNSFDSFVTTPRSSPAKKASTSGGSGDADMEGGEDKEKNKRPRFTDNPFLLRFVDRILSVVLKMQSMPDETPETDYAVSELSWILKSRDPKFPGFKYGYLYATECPSRRVVPVPVDYYCGPVRTSRAATVNELFTECWVPSSQPPNISNMSVGRLYVDTFPLGSSFKLEFAYTIFYVPQHSIPPQTNLNTCKPVVRAGHPWFGNILVVRHGKRDPVIGVDRWDGLLVDVIVSSLISSGALT